MKKKFFLSVFLFMSMVYAQPVLFSPEYRVLLTNGFLIENGTGFEPYRTAGECICTVTMPELSYSAGMKFSSLSYDFTTDAVYWPLFLNRVNIGIGAKYHFLSYADSFCEHDIIAGGAFRYTDRRTFTMTADIDYFCKISQIYAIKKTIPYLVNNSIAVNTKWNWMIGNTFDFYFSLSSYSYFRYYLFWAPDFMTGCCYYFPNGIGTGAEIDIQYIDMLTLSAYFDSIEIRFFSRILF
jgi:hypothetical protein